MTTCDVGTSKLLTPAQKCTEHAVVFQYSIGLPSTDDPLIGEIFANLKFSILTKRKNCFQLVDKNLEKEKITTLERVFLVYNNLLCFDDSNLTPRSPLDLGPTTRFSI